MKKRIIQYLRDCLIEERSRSGIPTLFATKVRLRLFQEGPENVATNSFAYFDLFPTERERLEKELTMRGPRVELSYGTLMICGVWRDQQLALPIYLYPVVHEERDDFPHFTINHSRARINPALASELPDGMETALLALLEGGEITHTTCESAGKILQNHFPDITLDFQDGGEDLKDEKAIKKAARAKSLTLQLASVIFLSDRSKNVSGVLHELQKISTLPDSDLTPSLRNYLGEITEDLVEKETSDHLHAPATLSETQLKVGRIVSTRALSVCQGAPGTGKTFTIASAAIERALSGEPTLITCRTPEACKVVEEKIAQIMESDAFTFRTGRSRSLKKMKQRIDDLLRSFPDRASFEKKTIRNHHRALKKEHDRITRASEFLQKGITHELEAAPLYQSQNLSLWEKFKKYIHRKSVRKSSLLSARASALTESHHDYLKSLRTFLQESYQARIAEGLLTADGSRTLRKYQKALTMRRSGDREAALLKLDLALMLQVFPIWISTTDDLHHVLPLTPGLFDFAIIDEGTLCDMASAVPVMARARRCLVTGDVHQLRHLSFLSEHRLKQLAEKNQLDERDRDIWHFRRNSLMDRSLDHAAESDSIMSLDEHFRSRAELIRFSNHEFYAGHLKLMREAESFSQIEPPLQRVFVPGTRNPEGVNHAEIEAALNTCREIASRDYAPLSLGFLSPFRAQVDAFENALESKLEPTIYRQLMSRHQLTLGTAHSFQGAEKDVMILSFCLDPQSSTGARKFLEKPDVFNVSVTRAREKIIALHSIQPADLPADSLLSRYLLISHEPQPQELSKLHTVLPGFLEKAQNRGWTILPHSTIAEIDTDLLLKKGNDYRAIDLIGIHGAKGRAVNERHLLLLQRAGITLSPLSPAEWQFREEEILASF